MGAFDCILGIHKTLPLLLILFPPRPSGASYLCIPSSRLTLGMRSGSSAFGFKVKSLHVAFVPQRET